jgi:sigma-B regulation protein RsbU (phosphoserine phosphatase)
MESNRDILAMRLTRHGHELATAGSGDQALEMLISGNYDLVIMDVLMPGLNGYQVLQRMAEIPQLKNVAILIHSSIDELDTIVRCLEMGAEDYLIRPSNMVVMNARINSCLEKKYFIDSERKTAEKLAEKQNQLSKELSEAADYVTSLIPDAFTSDTVTTDWRFFPSSVLSGDSLGYHWIDENHFACYLVDVCGHGIGAALLSVSAINTLNTSAMADVDNKDPAQVLSGLNQIYAMESQGGKYFTMWYAVYDKTKHTLCYACAGHPPAILIQGDAKDNLEMELLGEGGGPITGFESDYQSGCIELKNISQLYVFSDGIYELEMPDGHMLAHSEFAPMLLPNKGDPIKGLDQIIEMMKQVTDKPTDDDVSLLSFSFRNCRNGKPDYTI